MDKLLLVGAGGFGRVVLEHVWKEYDCAFLDDRNDTDVYGVSIIGNTSELEKFFPKYKQLLVTIGNNKLREQLYKKARNIGYSFPNIIVPSAYISPRAHLGSGVIILNNAVIQSNSWIGNGTIINPGVEAHHDSIIGDYCLVYTNSVVRSLAKVGDRVWIGSIATVSTSAIVPDDTIIDDGGVYRSNGDVLR